MVAAGEGLLLQPVELGGAAAQLVELAQHGEGREAAVVGALRGVEEGGADLAGGDAGAALEVDADGRLLVDGADAGAQHLLGVGVEAVGRGAGGEELHLLGGGERRDDGGERVGVALGLGLAHAGEDGELGGDAGGVGRHVPPDEGPDLRVVDALLVDPAPQVGRAHQLEAAAEAGELGVLAEGGEVDLVGAADHDHVGLHGLLRERHLARLQGELEVAEGVDGPLEEIAELEDAAGCLDQLAVGLEEGGGLEGGGQRGERAVGRDLALAGVDRERRADGDRAHPVAPRDEVALHLHVAQRLGERALVGGLERLEHLLVLVGELAAHQPVGRALLLAGGVVEALNQSAPLGDGEEEERVVAQLDDQAAVDLIVVEVGVGGARGGLALGALGEPERAAHRLPAGEDPVEAVERALFEGGVVLQRAEDAGRHRALGRAVGPVHEHQPVGPPLLHEVGEAAVDLGLQLLVADERELALVIAPAPLPLHHPTADRRGCSGHAPPTAAARCACRSGRTCRARSGRRPGRSARGAARRARGTPGKRGRASPPGSAAPCSWRSCRARRARAALDRRRDLEGWSRDRRVYPPRYLTSTATSSGTLSMMQFASLQTLR